MVMKLIDEVSKLKDNLNPIVLQLKVHYNRPRPSKLARALVFHKELNFTVHPLKTAETPAYPSGHTAYGNLVALILSEKYPEYSKSFQAFVLQVGEARVLQGVHYPSDNDAAVKLTNNIWRDIKGKTKKLASRKRRLFWHCFLSTISHIIVLNRASRLVFLSLSPIPKHTFI